MQIKAQTVQFVKSSLTCNCQVMVNWNYFHHVVGKKKFAFRGCDWKPIDMRPWTDEKKAWIQVIVDLFEQMFGGDFLSYTYDRQHALRLQTMWHPVCQNTATNTGKVTMVATKSHLRRRNISAIQQPTPVQDHLFNSQFFPNSQCHQDILLQHNSQHQHNRQVQHNSQHQHNRQVQHSGQVQQNSQYQHNSHHTQSSHHQNAQNVNILIPRHFKEVLPQRLLLLKMKVLLISQHHHKPPPTSGNGRSQNKSWNSCSLQHNSPSSIQLSFYTKGSLWEAFQFWSFLCSCASLSEWHRKGSETTERWASSWQESYWHRDSGTWTVFRECSVRV